jgi:hypothetical protein
MKWLANLLDRFLDKIAPMPDFTGPDWLTDEEALREEWLSDEIWAAHMNSADPPTHSESAERLSGVPTGSPDLLVTPAGVDQSPASAVSPGGFVTDEERIQELVADYEDFLRNLFRS